MAFESKLAERVRHQLGRRKNLIEKKMFGGLCFLLDGNMCCGVLGDELIVRVEPAQTEALLREKHTRIFDFSGKPMKGWVFVGPKGVQRDTDLTKWVQISVGFAKSLPAKE